MPARTISSKIRYRSTEPLMSPQIMENLRQVIEVEKYLSPGGPWVARFEQRWKEVCGVKVGVSTDSGTSALYLAMHAARVGPGDEVIVPAMTCPETLNAVSYVGATPVIVDIERSRLCMDPNRLKDAVTPRTKAVVPAHLYGCPVDPDVFRVCRQLGLLSIEDATVAHGAEQDGRKAGAMGDVGCFSFCGETVLGHGMGGMLTTDDVPLAERVRYVLGLASPGGFDRYSSTEMCYSNELSNVHAAICVAQIETLDETIRAKRMIAGWYDELLAGCELSTPQRIPGHVWWRYGVLLKQARPRQVHDALMDLGIETIPPFTPVYRIPMYARGHDPANYPVAEDVYARTLALPISPSLLRSDVEEIVRLLRQALTDTSVRVP